MAGIEVEIRVDNDEMLMDEGKESSEEEEGEIVDNEDDDDPFWVAPKQPDTRDTHVVPRLYKNNEFSVFSIDREFLEINDETKLQERARRFNLEAETKKRPAITLKQLERLYNSMGITPNDSNTRLNSLHMRGTQNMDTQQVFDYFKQYGPAAIEWVNDFCCNVVWVDEISAARALLGLSVPIRGVTNPRTLTPRYELDEDIRATLVHSLGDDMEVDEGGKSIPVETEDDESAVDISRVRIPVPPGTWRCGVPASSGGEEQDILLRFATKSDRKLPRAERSSEYYRTFGNPNYGGMPGLISASRKRKLRQFSSEAAAHHLLLPPTLARQAALFEDVGDECLLKRDARLKLPSAGGNPWVNLAKTWSNFERNKNKIAPLSPLRTIPPPPSPRSSEDSDLESARNRLGAPGDSGEDSDSWRGGRGRKIARRMHADVEEKKLARRRESNLRTRLNQLIGAHMRERVGPQRPSPSPPSSSPTPDELGGALPEDIAITFRNPGPDEGGPGGPEEDGSPLYEDEEEEGEGELEEEGEAGVGGEIEEDGEIDEDSEQERDGDSSDSEAGARRGRPRRPVIIKTEPDIPIGRDGRMMLGKSGPPPTRIKLERPDRPAPRFRAIKIEKTTTSGGSGSVERSKAVAGGASENGEDRSETRSENRDESRSRAVVKEKPSEKQRSEKRSEKRPEKLSEKRADRRRTVKEKLSEKGSSDKRAAASLSKNADDEIEDLVADVERLVDPGMNDEEEISAAVTVLKKDRKQKKGRERRRRRRRERSSSSESSTSDSSRSSSGSSSSSDSSSSSSSSSDSSSSSSSNSSSSSSSSSSSNSSTAHQKRSKKGTANSKRNGGDKSSNKSGASSKKTSSTTKKSSSRQESFKTGSRKTIKQEIPAKSVLKGADKNSAPFKPRNFGANADITRVEVRRSLSPPTGDENTRGLPRRNEVLSGRRDVLSDNRRRPREEETADSRRRPDAHDDERMEEDDFASASGFGRDRDENNRKRRSPPKTSSGKFGKSRYSSESPSARHYSRSEKYFANRAPTDRESPRRNRNYTSRNEASRSGRFVDGSRNGDRISSRRGDGIRRRIDSFDRSGRGRNRRQETSSHEENADDDTIFDKREVSGAKIVDLREKLKKKSGKASSSVPDKERLNIAVQIDNDNYRARRRGEASSEEESNEESDL